MVGIDGFECERDDACGAIEPCADVDHDHRPVGVERDLRCVMIEPGRDRERHIREVDLGELEAVEVEIGVELSVTMTCSTGALAVGSFSNSIW